MRNFVVILCTLKSSSLSIIEKTFSPTLIYCTLHKRELREIPIRQICFNFVHIFIAGMSNRIHDNNMKIYEWCINRQSNVYVIIILVSIFEILQNAIMRHTRKEF